MVTEAVAPGPPLLRAWWLTALIVLTGFSFGVFLNDEGGQLETIYHLRQGNLDGNETPLQYYAIAEGTLLPVWESNPQSPLVTLMGVALYYPVKAIDALVPVLYLLVALWGLALYWSVRGVTDRVSGHDRTWHEGDKPADAGFRWMARNTSFPHRLLLAVVIISVLLLWVAVPHLDYTIWGELVAVQLGHSALTVTAAVLFKRMLTHWSGDRMVGWVGWGLFMASPILFWGIGVKYHAMSVFLTVLTMWLWQRPDRWRYGALGTAGLGVATTPLGLPLLTGVGLLTLVDLYKLRQISPRVFWRNIQIGGGTLVAAIAGFAAYNTAFYGRWGGRLVPAYAEIQANGGLLGYLKNVLRFESWDQSFENLWRVFIDSRPFESSPASLLALMPVMVFAFAVPVLLRMRKQRADPQVWLAGIHIVVFFLLYVHALNRPGAGADNRFAVILLPSFILLVLCAVKPALQAAGGRLWATVAWAAPAVLLLSIVILMYLADAKHAVYDPQPALQVRQYAYVLGTATWIAWSAFAVVPRAKWPVDRVRVMGVLAGASVAAPVLWLFHTMILFRRSLPPWPFGSGADEVSFVLPHWSAVRQWVIETLLPI